MCGSAYGSIRVPFRISFTLFLKVLATAGVLFALFAEFGGGPVAIDRQLLREDRVFLRDAPEMPGLAGRLGARWAGTALPAPVPVPVGDVCASAADEVAIYVMNTGGQVVPVDALRHCREGGFALAMAGPSSGLVPIDEVLGANLWVTARGSRLVGLDSGSVWQAAMAVAPGTFLPWFLLALLVRGAGIGASILAWVSLLDAQAIRPGLRRVTEGYFVGRFWGIVTPGTIGLDVWRWVDAIRLSDRVVAPGIALVVDRLLGLLVVLTTLCAALAWRGLPEGIGLVAVALAVVVVLLAGLLVRPPTADSVGHPWRAAFTAYSQDRRALVRALGGTIVAHGSVVGMVAASAFALGVERIDPVGLLAATVALKLGTAVLPGSIAGAAAMVALLGGEVTPSQAFLLGQLAAWIEKVPLSVPGAFFLLRDRVAPVAHLIPVSPPAAPKPMMEASG